MIRPGENVRPEYASKVNILENTIKDYFQNTLQRGLRVNTQTYYPGQDPESSPNHDSEDVVIDGAVVLQYTPFQRLSETCTRLAATVIWMGVDMAPKLYTEEVPLAAQNTE